MHRDEASDIEALSRFSLFDGLVADHEQPRRRNKLPEVVAAEIASDIFTRGLRAGDPLPTEPEMREALQVSRATLREAVRVLETRGVISMRTGRGQGPVVARPSVRALADVMSDNFRLQRVTFDEVLTTRAAIEPMLAIQAATHRSADDLGRLRDIHRAMEDTPRNSLRMRDLNRQWHTAIAVASGVRPLAMLWAAISSVADGGDAGTVFAEEHWQQGLAAHAAIMEAIQERDATAAGRRMDRHIKAFHRTVGTQAPALGSVASRGPRRLRRGDGPRSASWRAHGRGPG